MKSVHSLSVEEELFSVKRDRERETERHTQRERETEREMPSDITLVLRI